VNTCPNCEHTLVNDGEQPNVVSGTMSTLGSCVNPSCDSFDSTFSFGERAMTRTELDKYAELRARLGIA